MILAAGRGERMRPLTDRTPKPLLPVRGKPLIVHHLEALARAGVSEVVINLAWKGEDIRTALGSGDRWGLAIHYSDEGAQALEAGGGILQALPLLAPGPFLVVNADVFTALDFGVLRMAPQAQAHLVLVPNPPQHPHGDFALQDGQVRAQGQPRFTYAGVGLFRDSLFAGCTAGRFPLLPLLQRAIAAGRLHGELFAGAWHDVGTMARWQGLNDEAQT